MHTFQWYFLYCSILLVVSGLAADFTSKKQAYCGSKLAKIMSEFCLAYYSPPEHRQKRQIVSECCHNHCSLDYLLENYCHTVDTEALESFKSYGVIIRPSETTTSAAQLTYRRLPLQVERNTTRENGSGIVKVDVKNHRKHKKRGKRNCICKERSKMKRMNKTIKLLRRVILGKTKTRRNETRRKNVVL